MIFFFGIACLAFYFALVYKSQSFTENEYCWENTPSIFAIVLKIIVRIIRRRQGKIYAYVPEAKESRDEDGVVHIPPSRDEVVVINGYRVLGDLVERFKAVCGEGRAEDKGTVPLCFPDCLFVHNLLLLVCKPAFKLSPLGLIHIRQSIQQHGDLQELLEGPCSLEARTTAYRLVARGVEVDISVRIIAQSQLCIWSGVATLLSRSRRLQSGGGVTSPSAAARPQRADDAEWEMQEGSASLKETELEAAADTGLKYARVSGDWNPHHLYTWSARLLGYRAPIAHGLWTLARAVALISGSTDGSSRFKKVECRFKRPLFLPGCAVVRWCTEGSVVRFTVTDSKTQAPHVVGTLKY